MQDCPDSSKIDHFGFLPCPHVIQFDGGTVSPVINYQEVTKWVEDYTNEDGFLFPPMVKSVKESGEEIPKTARPAHLHRVPASHELKLSFSGTNLDCRKGPSAFVMHLLAYLFGVRLQFVDWWFDGRIPIRSTHNITVSEATTADFLSRCYRVWLDWGLADQKLITNVLFMHSRASSYEWDWERFMIEYRVFDACYKLSKNLYGVAGVPSHKERIKAICETFGIPYHCCPR